jgi:putative Holliday junction resolvase
LFKEAAISRILGLDVGDVRVGLALSDPMGILASPLTIISRQNSPADVEAIIDIARKNDVARIIVGLPYSMDGSFGSQAEKVCDFVTQLCSRTDTPVEFRDERLTTVLAKKILQTSRKTSKDTKYDAAAAAVILQGYLDDVLPPREYQPDEEVDMD